MLFFRSEEMVKDWCAARGVEPRPMVTIPQLWKLSTIWYATRLTPESRRPGAGEMREVFASIGLQGSFWDPQADSFSGDSGA